MLLLCGDLAHEKPEQPAFRTVTRAARSWNSPLLDAPRPLAETLGLHSGAPAALGATSQISVASNRAGLYGEASQHFHLECRGQTGLCFAPSPMPAEFPEIAEGLWEPLGCSFWGIPPSASHTPDF